MLELFTKHGGFDLKLHGEGDLDVDQHHTVEDVGIVLGQLFAKALGDRKGINRAGYFVLPMDETLAVVARRSRAAGRRWFTRTGCKVRLVGDLQTELVRGFLRRLRESRRREPAREGAVRPLESSQDRSDLQMLRAGHAIRLFEGPAAEGPVALHQGAAVIAISITARAICVGREHAGRNRRGLPNWFATPPVLERRRKSFCPGWGISVR